MLVILSMINALPWHLDLDINTRSHVLWITISHQYTFQQSSLYLLNTEK